MNPILSAAAAALDHASEADPEDLAPDGYHTRWPRRRHNGGARQKPPSLWALQETPPRPPPM